MTQPDYAETAVRCEYTCSISERPIISVTRRDNLLAVSCEDGSVRIMRVDERSEVAKIDPKNFDGEPTSICFKNSDTLLVSAGYSVHAPQFNTGKNHELSIKLERSWPVSTEEINCICALDNRRIAVADDSGAVSVLNLEQGVVKNFSPRLCHAQMCTSLTYQAKSGSLFSGGMDCKIKQWSVKTKSLLDELDMSVLRSSDQLATQFNPPYVNCLTSDDEYMLAGLGDGSILVHRRSPRARAREEHNTFLNGHTLAVNTISLTPDSQFLISGSNDKTCRLWSLISMKCIAIYEAKFKINTIASLPNAALVGDVGGFLTKLTW